MAFERAFHIFFLLKMGTGKIGETGVAVQHFVAGDFLGGHENARIQDLEGLEYVQRKDQAVK